MRTRFTVLLLLFLSSLCVFSGMRYLGVNTDIEHHVYYVFEFIKGEKALPVTFGLYLVIYLFSLFTTGEYELLLYITYFILSIAIIFKTILSYKFVESRNNFSLSKSQFLIFCFCCVFIFCLPNLVTSNMYFGNFTPNVWHNSTTIAVVPFSILLFWISLLQIEKYSSKRNLFLLALIFANLIIKPSFLFSFFPVYPVLMYFKYGLSRPLRETILSLALGIFFLGFIYFSLYQSDFSLTNQSLKDDGLGLGFMDVWLYSLKAENVGALVAAKSIIITATISLFIPIIYAGFYFKEVIRSFELRYAYVLFISGFFIFIFLVENNARKYHGNLSWQNVINLYILFLVIASKIMNRLRNGERTIRVYFLAASFLVQTAFGIYYIFHIFKYQNYI